MRIWNTKTWRETRAPLRGHKLTVTRAAFDPTDEWIASGSRDRQVCVFRRTRKVGNSDNDEGGGDGNTSHGVGGAVDADGNSGPGAKGVGSGGVDEEGSEPEYVLHQVIAKAHDRIVWDVAWAPSGTHAFATGSRDKTIKIWTQQAEGKGGSGGQWAMACKLGKLAESVTALDWAFSASRGMHVLAVGFDDGAVVLHATSIIAATSG